VFFDLFRGHFCAHFLWIVLHLVVSNSVVICPEMLVSQ